MVELGTDPAAGDDIRPWVTTRGVTRVVAIVVAVTATALWMSVAWGNRNLYSRPGIGAVMLTGLLAVVLPLALRPNRPSRGTPDDGARITAVAAAAVLVIGAVAFADHYAVAARFADGTRGTLQVEAASCEQACDWEGFFWVRHGPHGKWVLKRDDEVTLADAPGLGPQPLNGFTVPVIDVGDPNLVYLPGGGPQWAQVKTIAVADSTAACSLIAAILLLRYRRSRRYRRINASLAPVHSGCSFSAVPGWANTPGQGPASVSRSTTETRCGSLPAVVSLMPLSHVSWRTSVARQPTEDRVLARVLAISKGQKGRRAAVRTSCTVTVRISYQTRAWFSGPWRLGLRACSAGFGV